MNKIYAVICNGVEWSNIEAVFNDLVPAKVFCDELNETNTKPNMQGFCVEKWPIVEGLFPEGEYHGEKVYD